MDKSKKIIIPVILVWVTFVFNIIFTCNDVSKMIKHKECTNLSDSHCSTMRMAESFTYIFLIIFFIIGLIGPILINASYCENSYCCYITGTIFLIIFSILITIIYANGNVYIIFKIAQILVQWIQIIVLIIYDIKYDFSDRNSYLNNKLDNHYQTQGQSLQLVQ